MVIKTMPNNKLFREAQALRREKPISELNEEELLTVKAADIPLDLLRRFNDKTTDEGLEELVQMVEEKEELSGNLIL